MQIGIHASNRQWANPQLSDEDKKLLLLMSPGVTAAKLFSYHREDSWEWVAQMLKPQLWLCRLNDLSDFDNLRSLYASGYRFVLEIGNEPNHPSEPWGASIDAFAGWYDQAQTIAAEDLPECPVCFPGLSPSFSPVTWWTSPTLVPFIERAKYLGVHSYYTQPELMYDEREGTSWLKAQRLFPSKRLLLTEFCCTAGESGQPRPRNELAREYTEYARWLETQSNVEGAFYFILGSDDQHWVDVGETFDANMAAALGALSTNNTGGNMSIAVALLPSNQDRNQSPVRPEYNEYGGMHFLAPLVEDRCRALGINAKWFPAARESQNSYHLAGLIAQQNAATGWLVQQSEDLKACVNFHTDSGDFSHTFAIYGTSKGPESQKLAEAIGPKVRDALGTVDYRSFSKLGDTDYNGYVFYQLAQFPACLIELCSHVHADDINMLFARPQEAAAAIAQGIANYAGLSGTNWPAEVDRWQKRYEAQVVVASGYKQRLEQIGKLAII